MSKTCPVPSRRGWLNGPRARVVRALFALFLISCTSPQDQRETPPPSSPPSSPPTAGPSEGSSGDIGKGVGLSFTARRLELEGDLEGAIEAYRKGLQREPDGSHWARSLTRVLFKAGKGAEAAAFLSRHLETHPVEENRLYLIDLLDRLGDSGRAEGEIRKILGEKPLSSETARSLSRRALRLGDVSQAAKILKAMKEPPSDPGRPHILAGELLLRRGYLEEAREAFEEALAKNESGPGNLGLAEVYARGRDWKGAAETAMRFIRKNARNVEALMHLGEYLEKAGRLVDAAQWLEKAVELRQDLEKVYPRLARVFRRLGRREMAVETYRKARALSPEDPYLAYELGTLLDETGAIGDAEKVLGAAAHLSGGAPFCSHYLAYLWAKRGIRLDEAEEAAREAVESDPEVGAYQAVLGFILFKKGREEEARSTFEKAVTFDPDPFAHRLFGDFLSAAGRKAEAVEQWRKAVQLDPRLKEVLSDRIREAGG